MKKILNFVVLFLIAGTLFTSCKKSVEDILPSKEGKWNYTTSYVLKKNGTQTSSGTDAGTITFTGSNYSIVSDKSSESGTWSASGKTITLKQGSTSSVTFTVVENKKKSQKWEGTDTEVVSGDTYVVEQKLNLTR